MSKEDNSEAASTKEQPMGDEIRQLMQETMALVNGGKVPSTHEEFWHQIGLMYQLAASPGEATPSLVRLVLEKLGIEWDDEFIEDDGLTPSLQAYESLFNEVKRQIEGPEAEETEEEEETTDALASAYEANQILVEGLDFPIQTIVEFIKDGTMVLDPDWQRGYVWKPKQRKKLIESIFMGLPIPPVLLFEDKDKRLLIIDGRQRLETVYRFYLGSGDRDRRFRTFDKNTPGWRPGERLNACAGKYFDTLPEEAQRQFKGTVIYARKFRLLPKPTLYEVFKRYNTGAVKLQAAEIRKAVYQDVPLHDMLFRIAGESGEENLTDPQEKRVARQLRQIMKKKTARYGAYNFVGRCLAFRHVEDDLTVAQAIIRFMEEKKGADINALRLQFLNALEATLSWYEYPLSIEKNEGTRKRLIYHEWIATIQVVSTMVMLEHITSNLTDEDSIKAIIARDWKKFVNGTWNEEQNRSNNDGVLQDKQNTRTHWGRQREWINNLELGCGISGK